MGQPQTHLRSFTLNKAHLELWERQHGRIPHGAFVMMRTNWDKFYNFRDKFFGFFADEQKQIFPGELFVYVDK